MTKFTYTMVLMLTTRLASVAAYNSVPSSQADISNNKTRISSANLQGKINATLNRESDKIR
jgi:hypothetical protein